MRAEETAPKAARISLHRGHGPHQGNLTLDSDVVQSVRGLGLKMARLVEAAITDAAKTERNRRWREQNRAAIDAYATEAERDDLPLVTFRTF